MTDLSDNDKQITAEFARAVASGDYRAASDLLVNISNAGNPDLAALLLQTLVEAGREAVGRMAGRHVTVTQTIGTVPEGATVIGYRGNRIGR